MNNCSRWNISDVRRYVEAFDINYQKSENDIIEAFREKQNIADKDVVKKRIHLLNVHYHTRVPIESMQDVIVNLQKSGQLYDWIESGAEEAVSKIAVCDGKNYFSFATKYCCFANHDKYPIYDSLSIKALQMFNELKGFYDNKIDFEKMRIEKNYLDYRTIVDNFKEKFELKDKTLNYKNLDKFLWLVGKNI